MSRYIKFVIETMEPVRIADDESSQHGQTDTLHYIPGSTIRGMVVNALAAEKELFQEYKKMIFSDHVHFLNAYLTADGRELVPSLKGFYEDKREQEGKKRLNNVLVSDVEPGFKRASLGRYCCIEDDCICYTDVAVREDMNIDTGRENKRNVFRSQYIQKNQCFAGYVTFDGQVDDQLVGRIRETFRRRLYIGNKRSAGYGKCRCTELAFLEGMPYEAWRRSKETDSFYLVLLSNTVMTDEYGEMRGLYLPELAERLGCSSLEIQRCATSAVEVHGYNRVWNGPVPTAVMYEAGSVFCIKASEKIKPESFRKLEAGGIGIRKNEGYGQIAVMEDYGRIQYKKKLEAAPAKAYAANVPKLQQGLFEALQKKGKSAEVQEDLKIAARGLLLHRMERKLEQYVTENPLKLPGISKSKLGTLESICLELRYEPAEAKRQILLFLEHDRKKSEGQKKHTGLQRQDALYDYVTDAFEKDFYERIGICLKDGKILGLSAASLITEEELLGYQLKLIISQIRYYNREVKNHA